MYTQRITLVWDTFFIVAGVGRMTSRLEVYYCVRDIRVDGHLIHIYHLLDNTSYIFTDNCERCWQRLDPQQFYIESIVQILLLRALQLKFYLKKIVGDSNLCHSYVFFFFDLFLFDTEHRPHLVYFMLFYHRPNLAYIHLLHFIRLIWGSLLLPLLL